MPIDNNSGALPPVIDPGDGSGYYNTFTVTSLTNSITWQHGSVLYPADIKLTVNSAVNNIGGFTSYKIYIYENVSNAIDDIVDFTDGNSALNFFTSTTGFFNKSIYLFFKNLQSLLAGYYTVDVYFTIYGLKNGVETFLNSASYAFDLIIQGQPDVIVPDKSIYKLLYNRETGTLTGDLNVLIQGNVNNAPIRFFNNLEIFKNIDPIINDAFILEPKIPLGNNQNLPTQGLYEISCSIFKKNVAGPDTNVKSFLIQLFILNGDIMVSPDVINFSLLQSAGEIKMQTLSIINPYNKNFTLEGPSWLEFSDLTGSQTIDIEVKTLNSMTIPVGDYNSNILVKYDNKVVSVAVSLSVISFIYLSGLEQYNFCLDGKIMNFIKQEASAKYVKATITVKFTTEAETKTMVVPLTVPYFNDRASFDLGYKIHQYFLRLKKSILNEPKISNLLDTKLWMNPAEVTALVEELDIDYNVVKSETVGLIKFYPGKKPAAFPLLSNNLVKQRVAGSKYIFSYIQGLVEPSKIGIGVPNVLQDGIITRLKIEDDEQKIIFPKKKVFDISVNKQLIYYTIPNNGPHVINIQYENQNLCPESFSFTGHMKRTPEYSHVFDQNVLSSIKEKYDVTKVVTRTINTGFIIKSCISIIDEIIMSRLCFLEIDGKILRGFVTSQKVVDVDTSSEMIQFDLDFLLLE